MTRLFALLNKMLTFANNFDRYFSIRIARAMYTITNLITYVTNLNQQFQQPIHQLHRWGNVHIDRFLSLAVTY